MCRNYISIFLINGVPRGQRRRVAPGGTSEGAALQKKGQIYVKNGQIYVIKGDVFGKYGEKSLKFGAAQVKRGRTRDGTIR